MSEETLTLEEVERTCHFDEANKVWVSPDGQHRYDPWDGEELITPQNDSFDDVSLIVLRRRYGYTKGTEIFNEKRKGGK